MRKETMLAIATAVLAVSGCKTSLGGMIKLPGGSNSNSGGGGGGAPAATTSREAPATEVASAPTTERPAWCNVEGAEKIDGASIGNAINDVDPRDAVFDIVGLFCGRFPETERRAELIDMHAKWSKRLRMNDADWRDAVEWSLSSRSDRAFVSINPPSTKVDGPDPMMQVKQFNGPALAIHAADLIENELTAAGRAALAEGCLHETATGAWLLCHHDLVAYDMDAIVKELRAATAYTAYERIGVRLELDLMGEKIAKRIDEMNALVARDPAWGQMLDVVATARKNFAESGSNPYYTAFREMSAARGSGSRKAVAGCFDKTRGALDEAITAIPSSKFAKATTNEEIAQVIADDTHAYLATATLLMCSDASGTEVDRGIELLATAMSGRPGVHGPRTMALTELFASGIELDDRNEKVIYPRLNAIGYGGKFARANGAFGVGVVASVDADGDQVTISFVPVIETYEECVSSRYTGRIERVTDDGRLIYEEECTKSVTKKYDAASKPMTVAARYATGVKKGVYVEARSGVVMQVRGKKGGALTAVFGVAK